MLSNKLKNLLRAYKASKDNSNRTGAGASSAPYQELMDEIFGSQPQIANQHTLDFIDEDCVPALDVSGRRYDVSDATASLGNMF